MRRLGRSDEILDILLPEEDSPDSGSSSGNDLHRRLHHRQAKKILIESIEPFGTGSDLDVASHFAEAIEKYIEQLRSPATKSMKLSQESVQNVPVQSYEFWFIFKSMVDPENVLPDVIQGAPEIVARMLIDVVRAKIDHLGNRYLGCSNVTITVYKANELQKSNIQKAPERFFDAQKCQDFALRTGCMKYELFAFD
jgi:hypothetical protein